MASKSDILNNLREYTSDQIAEAINAGTVTMYELSKSGNLTPLMRRRIEEKLVAKTSDVAQAEPEVVSLEQEVAPTLNEKESSVNTESSDFDEEVIIPKAPDIEVPSGITIPQTPVITATESPTIEADNNEHPSPVISDVISNKGMFKRPFSFEGRIRRLEYGLSFIIYFVWYVIFEVAAVSPNLSQGAAIFLLITIIPAVWFVWAQSCKRCHDRGNSGWYQLIPFYFLVLLFGDGDEGENEYGDNPKE